MVVKVYYLISCSIVPRGIVMVMQLLSACWSILVALSLWLFAGAAIAGLLKIWLPDNFIVKHMGKPSFSSIFKISLLGVPLPLCSCGVLPTAISLKKSGANNGAAVSFLISTPQTGVDSILVTASFLGWPLALFKVLAALVTGVIGGLLTQLSEKREPAAAPLLVPTRPLDQNQCASDMTCGATVPATTSKWRAFYNYTIEELIGGVYLYLLIGIILAALISVFFPSQLLTQYPALKGPLGMLIMLAIATPLYICTTGSVPIAASLIHAGLPMGSALVFLMAGPATNAATMGAVYKSFGKKITFIYLGTVVVAAIGFGLLFQHWLGGVSPLLSYQHVHHAWWRQVIDTVAAVGLTALIVNWGLRDLGGLLKRLRRSQTAAGLNAVLKVTGMSCNNCAGHVRHAIENIKGVQKVEIELESGEVKLYGRQIDLEHVLTAIGQAGYQGEVV
jgi:hypothetical protein